MVKWSNPGVVDIENGPFESPSTKIVNSNKYEFISVLFLSIDKFFLP